jgi:hypothetical protein
LLNAFNKGVSTISEYGESKQLGALFGSRNVPKGRDGRPSVGPRPREWRDREDRIRRTVDPPVSRTIGNMVDRKPRPFQPPSKRLQRATERPLEAVNGDATVRIESAQGYSRRTYTPGLGLRTGFYDKSQRERLEALKREMREIGD